jgi:hypothetical protein
MTLVVARSLGDAVVVVSDLRVTDRHEMRRGYPFAVLKAVTISPTLCVAFAGPVERALDGLRAAADLADGSFDSVVARLAGFLPAGRADGPEFLIVSSQPPRIARLRAGSIEDHQPASWIGDIDAFEEFQRLAGRRDSRPIAGLTPRQQFVGRVEAAFSDLLDGVLRDALKEPSIPSVGEASVTIASGDDGAFRYLARTFAHASATTTNAQPTVLKVGTAAQGGFAYSVLTPTQPGQGAIGIYFYQGRLGLLYHPLQDRYPIPYSGVTAQDFRLAVSRDHAIDLQGMLIAF